MPKFAKDTQATVISCLRYRDAPAAIEWLCNTFGFEKHLVVPNADGTIAHAQLSFGNGMIMLGSVQKDDDYGGRGFSCLELESHLWKFDTYAALIASFFIAAYAHIYWAAGIFTGKNSLFGSFFRLYSFKASSKSKILTCG